ncbi:uncharacterized protein [Nicotiana sylvestris]|uniref:Uncharacterized protein LOC104224896 n=1 Tax=Nicotiana sylvestris TaxID=4096 RepID=A0A1U7WCF1_NICSY|nr:PREDICTED: uncharacterized protein LOC104224896 [Nicotiana sylvestris]
MTSAKSPNAARIDTDKENQRKVAEHLGTIKLITEKEVQIHRKLDEELQNNKKYFVVKFNSVEDRDAVLMSGPHTIRNKPIIVKAWSPNFDFDIEVLQTIPIWVKLPNLPLNCWSMDSVSRIGNGLGIPIYSDECTTKVERIYYARLLVEMDIIKDMLRVIKVIDPTGKVFEQQVAYDWIPEYCHTCLQVGHVCRPAQIIPEAKQ